MLLIYIGIMFFYSNQSVFCTVTLSFMYCTPKVEYKRDGMHTRNPIAQNTHTDRVPGLGRRVAAAVVRDRQHGYNGEPHLHHATLLR